MGLIDYMQIDIDIAEVLSAYIRIYILYNKDNHISNNKLLKSINLKG